MGKRLGVSGNWISLLESGDEAKARPSDHLIRSLHELALDSPLPARSGSGNVRKDDEVEFRVSRMIPVIGWAHAGEAASYEEVPESWQCKIPTECRDPNAFAVALEGDSMESSQGLSFTDGDLLVIQPNEEPHNGCFVVARFSSDGVIFRRMEMAGDDILLKPLNDRYPVTKHAAADFSWIYPVWGRFTQIWRR